MPPDTENKPNLELYMADLAMGSDHEFSIHHAQWIKGLNRTK